MKLRDIVPPALVVSVDGDMNVEPSGLAYDSRDVLPGYVFFALPGLHADGHRFIHEAIRAGASAIIHEQALEAPCPAACCVRVNDARAAMSPVASAFYGSPSSRLAVIGVTGTEGKSTTVWLIYRLLDLAGKKAGFFSTVDRRIGGAVEPNPRHQTTPEATSVQRMLDSMANAGYEYAVV
ncbi:MAG: UDP-N-acetylmuramyl peptide synthase, partial [Spirochaetales bacterium]|nr:UDP-N-acetylmuramyl peptide synthase [Spirochaetales bacterium]